MAREYSPSTTASVSLNAPQHPWTCLCTACRNAFDLNEGLARKRPTATVHGWPQRLREIRATVSATMQSDNDGALLSVLDSLLEPQHPRRAQPEALIHAPGNEPEPPETLPVDERAREATKPRAIAHVRCSRDGDLRLL